MIVKMLNRMLGRGWLENAAILRQALEIERDRIGSEQAGFVAEYLDHGEIGLARQQLLDALDDLEVQPFDQTAELLAKEAALQP